jgi:phosphoserine aminotransferase
LYMSRVYNFSPGPSALPLPVLEQARDELLDWHGQGMSLMEMGHRTTSFETMAARAEADLRELLDIPANYKVLFLSGGARVQFAMVPLNLLGQSEPSEKVQSCADYIDTGIWSQGALKEAQRYGKVNIAASSAPDFMHVPSMSEWQMNPSAAYLHYTSNETITGVQFSFIPDTGNVPLVADMSSDLLSQPIDIARFGLIYASAQKNIGPSGLTVVIVRDDLLDRASLLTPTVFHYKTQAEQHSLYNTPPTYSWYLSGLVFEWLKSQGGVEAIAKINQSKAEKLYQAIDQSAFYSNPVRLDSRSRMNAMFCLANPELDPIFLREASLAGLANLKGHRLLGGMRASLYNAVPEAAVDALIAFMRDFEARYG